MRKLIVCLLLLPSLSWAATPTISNVTGTVSEGQHLTLSGTDMVNEDATAKTNWLSFFKSGTGYGFEGSSPVAGDGYGDTGNSGTYVSSVKLMGSQSYQSHISGASSNCPTGNLGGGYNYVIGGGITDYWLRGYVRYNSADNTWPTTHLKMWEAFYSPTPNTYIQPSNGPSAPTSIRIIHAGADGYRSIPSGAIQNDRWYLIEAHITNSTVDIYVDNQYISPSYSKSANALTVFSFGIINACGTSTGFDLYGWQDNLAVSTSRVYGSSVVEVSGDNGSTWTYQPPTSLSDTSITITAELPTLTADSYLLRVTNNLNETSATYNLSGSAVSPGLVGVTTSGVTIR